MFIHLFYAIKPVKYRYFNNYVNIFYVYIKTKKTTHNMKTIKI